MSRILRFGILIAIVVAIAWMISDSDTKRRSPPQSSGPTQETTGVAEKPYVSEAPIPVDDALAEMKDQVPILFFDQNDASLAVNGACFITVTRPQFDQSAKAGKRFAIQTLHDRWRTVSGKKNSYVTVVNSYGQQVGGTSWNSVWLSDE